MVLTGVKGLRYAPPPLRGADALDAASAHARPDLALNDDARSDAPFRQTAGRFVDEERLYGMPVRSCLRSYGPERSITVKHY